MLSAKDNELMCRTNPDTPMGQAIRHRGLKVAEILAGVV